MQKHILCLLLILSLKKVSAQTFLNGDFENNTAPFCQLNLPNGQFNSYMSNTKAYGLGNQVDIQNSSCGFGSPANGNWFISLAQNTMGNPDMVSMQLSTSLIPGNSYTFCYYEKANEQYTNFDVIQIGLSTTETTFGTLISSSQPLDGLWTQRTVTFIAPNAGSYITLKSGSSNTSWNFVDNFSFNCCVPFDLGNDTTICQGGSLVLDATSEASTYLWQDNSTNPTFTATEDGIYWVQITNSCGISSDSISITYSPIPSVDLGNDTVLCQGQTLILDATITGATYLWQNNSTNPTFTVSQPGTYWVNATIDNCGNTADSILITYNQLPVINFGNDTVLCQGDILFLDATTLNALYLWQDNSINSTYTINQSGTFWVDVLVNNCSVTETINVTYNSLPQINLGNDTVLCEGNNITLNATNLASTYLWQNNSTNPTLNANQPGNYWVEVTNNCGTIYDSINLTYSSLPLINLGNDSILCSGNNLFLDAISPDATYLWQDNSTNSNYTVTQEGIYWVNVLTSCGVVIDTINIQYNLIPTFNFSRDTVLCQGNNLVLDVFFEGASYLWQDNTTNSTFTVSQNGIFWVEVSNSCGLDSDTINIEIKNCDCDIFIPNTFSPNKDGTNDYYSPVFECDISEYNFTIINRWGEIIFETSNSMDKWDGSYLEKTCPDGMYQYIVKYKSQDEKAKIFYGHVFLIR